MPEQVTQLRDLWGTMKDAEVAAVIGKTTSAIRLKATAIKLRDEKGKRAGTRNGSVTSPWSKDEEMVLIKNVGHCSIFELLELLPKRTRASIESRCRRLGFSPTQGTYTRCGIERATGYDWRQIKRARDGLNQQWKKYGLRKYIITEEQYDEIIAYLKDEPVKWSKQWGLDGCVVCGTSGRGSRERHSGDGRCKIHWDARRYIRNSSINRIIKKVYPLLTEQVYKGLKERQ